MAGYLVTQSFTRNGIATQAIPYVPASFAASATAAMNQGVATAQNMLNIKAAANGDALVFGSSSVVVAP